VRRRGKGFYWKPSSNLKQTSPPSSRLTGTNEKEGRAMLQRTGLYVAETMGVRLLKKRYH
jgi:succinyl-CoA synthetase beta subunit